MLLPADRATLGPTCAAIQTRRASLPSPCLCLCAPQPLEGNPVIQRFAKLAAELGVVLPSECVRQRNSDPADLRAGLSAQQLKTALARLVQPVATDFSCSGSAHQLPALPLPRPAVSFFERAGNAHFNALVVLDADGSLAGHYRKSHIPDGPGCE